MYPDEADGGGAHVDFATMPGPPKSPCGTSLPLLDFINAAGGELTALAHRATLDGVRAASCAKTDGPLQLARSSSPVPWQTRIACRPHPPPAKSMYWKAKGDVLRAEHRIATASSDKATAAFHVGLAAVSGNPELVEIAGARYEQASAKLEAAESDLPNAEAAVAGRQAALDAWRAGQSA